MVTIKIFKKKLKPFRLSLPDLTSLWQVPPPQQLADKSKPTSKSTFTHLIFLKWLEPSHLRYGLPLLALQLLLEKYGEP